MKTNKNLFIAVLSLVLLLGFATVIIKNWVKIMKKRSQYPIPPGPIGWPIIGSIPQMMINKPTFRWIHKLMQQLNTEIACIRLGNILVIPVTSPELSREFLKKYDAIFASRPNCMTCKMTSDDYLTTIISPMGDQWKKMRRIMTTQVLSPAMHEWLYKKLCNEEADHLVKYVYNKCKKDGVVNVRVVAQHYCGNVTKKLLFGKRFFSAGMEDEGPGVEDEEHMDGIFQILYHLYGFAIADYVPWMEVFDLDGYKKILKCAIKNVRKYQDLEIDKRVKMWKHGIRKIKEDILDVLVNLNDSNNTPVLSIEEIKAQIMEIMVAAIDNPSNAVEWAIAEMINNPDILKRACKELDEVVGKDRLVKESDLPKLNYVKACVKETFRLHPIAPFNVPHVSTEDAIVGGYFIPKGSHVLLSRLGLGRNPRAWENPLTYIPDRHIVDESSNVILVEPELRMLSFSTGRRGCPGIVLGSTMTTILLARLIQGFTWTTPLDSPSIDLVESERDLFLVKPLIVCGTPRLEEHIYAQFLE